MPCQGGPTNAELAFMQRMANDPIFCAKQREKWRKEDIRMKKLTIKRVKEEKKELENELTNHTLEKIFFNSAMTVFLCRTMQIVIANFGYKFLPIEFEWWWLEHAWRDTHNDESKMDPKELAKKLISLNRTYKVDFNHHRTEEEFIVEIVKESPSYFGENIDLLNEIE